MHPGVAPGLPSPFSAASATFLLNCLGESKPDRRFGSLLERRAQKGSEVSKLERRGVAKIKSAVAGTMVSGVIGAVLLITELLPIEIGMRAEVVLLGLVGALAGSGASILVNRTAKCRSSIWTIATAIAMFMVSYILYRWIPDYRGNTRLSLSVALNILRVCVVGMFSPLSFLASMAGARFTNGQSQSER